MAHIKFLNLAGFELSSGSLNNVFSDVASGAGVSIAYVQVLNNTSGTLTTSRTYLSIDAGGASVTLAVADGTARDSSYGYAPVAPSSWSAPTSYAAGLALPDLAAGKKCLIAIRRDPAGAAVAYPERNSVLVTSTGAA